MSKLHSPLDPIAVGLAARAIREKAGLSLSSMADRACVSLSSMSRVETGARQLEFDEATAICESAGVSLDELARLARSLQDSGHVTSQAAARKKLELAQAEMLASSKAALAVIKKMAAKESA
jgi:transcriptional regulator with XRE-family HTH domain